jgi:glycosyltransferase involved in cell wall biosynthesis
MQDTVYCKTNLAREKLLSSSLKVFSVFFHPSTSVTAMGGAEKRFVEILKILCTLNQVRITVLESAPSLLDKAEVACKKHSLSTSLHGKGWLDTYIEWMSWSVKAFFQSMPIIHREKPAVILIPNNTLSNLAIGYIISAIFRVPACVVVHHVDTPFADPQSRANSLYDGYRRIDYSKTVSLLKTLVFYVTLPILRRMKTVISVSDFTAKTLESFGVSHSRISISGNAIDLRSINKAKILNYIDGSDAIFVGRIAKEKGVFDLVEIWKDIAKTRKNAKLVIVGNGLELTVLKQKIVETGLQDSVLLREQCSDEELYSLLKSSRLFIFPSLFEGWGIAVAEALACGLPVVAYDIPALRETFGKCESVFLLPVKDVSGMINVVSKVLDSGDEKLCNISRDFAESFEWHRVALVDLEAIQKTACESLE